jgi:multidrug efflux pump subunit AcrA (membrane-fusion protein)
MIHRYVLPLLAVGLLAFAVAHALYIQRPEPETPPPVPPPLTPFGDTVAGAGMVEPSTEASGTGNIAVGSQLAGAVTKIHVRIGQTVKAGDLLFGLDERQAEADLKFRQTALAVAQEQLRRLRLQPRPEEVPASEAQVEAAEANLRQQQDQYERARRLIATRAIGQEEFVTREQTYQSARAQLVLAKANLALLKAGAWEPDKAIAFANVEQARAQVEQAKTTLDLLQVRAPVDGTILQVNVRPGEYVSTFGGQSLILMGNLRPPHVRVNVDEEDLPRLKLYAPARAKIRGDARQEEVPLSFVRLEPYVVPKVSLTGINVERVDTRVVQVIYAIDPRHRLVQEKKVLVGQLVDVFIDTRPTGRPEEYSRP